MVLSERLEDEAQKIMGLRRESCSKASRGGRAPDFALRLRLPIQTLTLLRKLYPSNMHHSGRSDGITLPVDLLQSKLPQFQVGRKLFSYHRTAICITSHTYGDPRTSCSEALGLVATDIV